MWPTFLRAYFGTTGQHRSIFSVETWNLTSNGYFVTARNSRLRRFGPLQSDFCGFLRNLKFCSGPCVPWVLLELFRAYWECFWVFLSVFECFWVFLSVFEPKKPIFELFWRTSQGFGQKNRFLVDFWPKNNMVPNHSRDHCWTFGSTLEHKWRLWSPKNVFFGRQNSFYNGFWNL